MGSPSIKSRCEKFGACAVQEFLVGHDNQGEVLVPIPISQIACFVRDIDLARIPTPTSPILNGVNFLAIIDKGRCSSDLDCLLRPRKFGLSGVVSGLKGSVSIKIEAKNEQLTIFQPASVKLSVNGPFTFNMQMPEGSKFRLTLSKIPKTQICEALNPERVMPSSELTDIQVVCRDK